MTTVLVDQGSELEGVDEPPRGLYPGDVLVHAGHEYVVAYVWAWRPAGSPVERHVTVRQPTDAPAGAADGWQAAAQEDGLPI